MLIRSTTPLASACRPRKPWAALGVVLALTLVCAPPVNSATFADDAKSGQFRVIVHPSNPNSSESREFIAQAFFKRTTRWHSGEAIHPVDLRPDSAVRRAFSGDVLQRSVAAVRSYWQQRIFSGRDLPPVELESDDAVVKYVANSPGAVGYVSPTAKLGATRELLLRP
jgi:hypothetical protein